MTVSVETMGPAFLIFFQEELEVSGSGGSVVITYQQPFRKDRVDVEKQNQMILDMVSRMLEGRVL